MIEELLHREGVCFGHHQSERVVRANLGSSKDVGEGEALVGEARWTLASFPPDMADASLLTDPRLVLKPNREAFTLSCECIDKLFQRSWGSF